MGEPMFVKEESTPLASTVLSDSQSVIHHLGSAGRFLMAPQP